MTKPKSKWAHLTSLLLSGLELILACIAQILSEQKSAKNKANR